MLTNQDMFAAGLSLAQVGECIHAFEMVGLLTNGDNQRMDDLEWANRQADQHMKLDIDRACLQIEFWSVPSWSSGRIDWIG